MCNNMCTSPMAQSHRGGHSRFYKPSEPKLHFLRPDYIRFVDKKPYKIWTLAVARCGVATR
jgi:hypothetical protein